MFAFVLFASDIAQAESQDFSHPIALLYAQPNLGNNFSFSERLTLPKIPRNHSWYAIWLMLVERNKRSSAGFLQVGLIRYAQEGFNLVSFVATKQGNHSLNFHGGFGRLDEGKSHFAWIRREGRDVLLGIDGKVLKRFKYDDFFVRLEARPYFQIGAEVSEVGDTASGTVSEFRLNGNPYLVRCAHFERGIAFELDGVNFVANGIFREEELGYYVNPQSGLRVVECANQ